MQLDLDLQPGDDRLFTDEALEQIEKIEQGLLALERGELDATTVNEVFRAAHTLKGSAGTIRHRRMAELTHAMEDIFGLVRSGGLTDVSPFADRLLETIDVLRALTDEVVAGETLTDAPESLTAELRALLATVTPGTAGATGPAAPAGGTRAIAAEPAVSVAPALRAAEPAEPAGAPRGDAVSQHEPLVTRVIAEAPPLDGARSIIFVVADEASEWQAIRLFQAVMEAEESGFLVASAPSREEIEGGVAGNRMALLLRGTPPALALVHARIREIEEISAEAPVAIDAQGSVAVVAPGGAPGPAPIDERQADAGPAARHAPPPATAEQRSADLGPEARGLAADERLAVAGERLKATQQTIRIDVSRLDELMNLVGELVVHKTRLQREAHEIMGRLGDDPLAREVDESSQQFSRIAGQIQDQVTRLRMLPIETVFNRFPRVVRDLAARFGKEVDLVIEGKETELDRSVLEEVGDPLTHLVRNALDHGVEAAADRLAAGKPARGRVTLAARHGDGQIVITVADDGAGIDPVRMRAAAVRRGILSEAAAAGLSDADAVDLIFAPGFSTAAEITDVSGRGVGMDVVRTNIARLGGRVDVRSAIGEGTAFELSLPLTLAIVGALLVRSGQRICALPLTGVVESLRVRREKLSTIRGHYALELRGRVVPVTNLDTALGDPERMLRSGEHGYVYLVVVRAGYGRTGWSAPPIPSTWRTTPATTLVEPSPTSTSSRVSAATTRTTTSSPSCSTPRSTAKS